MLDVAMRYFLEVALHGSIAEAAQHLNVASSAISRQIAKLEHEIGVVLFDRRPRGMVLSPAGQLLAAHARRTALDAERVIDEIRDLRGLQRGTVRIACMEGWAVGYLPELMAGFRRTYDGIRFNLHVASPGQVSGLVRNGEVDIGITFSLTPEKDIKVEKAITEPVNVVMRADHPLARRRRVTLAMLKDYPLALPTAETTIRRLLEIACAADGVRLEPVLVSNNVTSLSAFVAAGGGLAFSGPTTARRRIGPQGLAMATIDNPTMQARRVELQTMAGRTLPHAVQAFLRYLIADIEKTHAAPPRGR